MEWKINPCKYSTKDRQCTGVGRNALLKTFSVSSPMFGQKSGRRAFYLIRVTKSWHPLLWLIEAASNTYKFSHSLSWCVSWTHSERTQLALIWGKEVRWKWGRTNQLNKKKKKKWNCHQSWHWPIWGVYFSSAREGGWQWYVSI